MRLRFFDFWVSFFCHWNTNSNGYTALMTLVHRQSKEYIEAERNNLSKLMHARRVRQWKEWVGAVTMAAMFCFYVAQKEQNIRRVMHALVYKQPVNQLPCATKLFVCQKKMNSWFVATEFKRFFVLVSARFFFFITIIIIIVLVNASWRFCFNDSGCSQTLWFRF